jgi:hypothetical protein
MLQITGSLQAMSGGRQSSPQNLHIFYQAIFVCKASGCGVTALPTPSLLDRFTR